MIRKPGSPASPAGGSRQSFGGFGNDVRRFNPGAAQSIQPQPQGTPYGSGPMESAGDLGGFAQSPGTHQPSAPWGKAGFSPSMPPPPMQPYTPPAPRRRAEPTIQEQASQSDAMASDLGGDGFANFVRGRTGAGEFAGMSQRDQERLLDQWGRMQRDPRREAMQAESNRIKSNRQEIANAYPGLDAGYAKEVLQRVNAGERMEDAHAAVMGLAARRQAPTGPYYPSNPAPIQGFSRVPPGFAPYQ